MPGSSALVEGHGDDFGLEADVATQFEAIGDEVQVLLDLCLRRQQLAPCPLLLDLIGEAVAVLDALDVAARPRIAIEQPRAADGIGSLEDAGPHPELAHLVQRVQPREPCSDDDDVQLVRHTKPLHLHTRGSPVAARHPN
jgi:hypothetical protein